MSESALSLRAVAQAAEKSCQELLAHYGSESATPTPSAPASSRYQGSVRLLGPDVQGICIVRAEASALEAFSESALPGHALLDWAGELANQLAGRMKHRLERRGIRTTVDLPVTCSNEPEVEDAPPSSAPKSQVHVSYQARGVAVAICLDVATGPSSVGATSPLPLELHLADFVSSELTWATSIAPKD